MPQLPDWTALGPSAVPTPSFRRVTPDNAGQILDSGVQSLAKGAGEVANEDFTRNVNLARAQSANAQLDHEIAVKTTAEQIHQDVMSGKLPYADARKAYDDQVAKIPVPQIANLDPVGQINLQKGVQRNIATSGFAIDGAVQVARQNDFKDQFAGNLDKLGKLAGMPGADIQGINDKADAFRPLAREAGLPPNFVDKAVQDFKDQNWFNDANQRAMTNKDNAHGLKLLQHDLVDNNGFYAGRLDTNKRNEVLRSVINDQLILENRAEHLRDKREAHAEHTVNQINMQISSGVPATAAMWAKWEGETKGTSVEGEFKQALADETTVQAVLREPLDSQAKYVQDKQQKLDTEGGSMRDRANLMRLQTAVNQNVNMMQKTPLLFSAVRNGTDVPPLDLQTLGKPDGQQKLAAQVADRMSTITALRKQYGSQVGLLPLLPQEASAISSQLNNGTPQDRLSLLTTLHQGFQNDDAYMAAMRQVAPHSPVSAIVGTMLGNSQPQATPVWFDRNFTSQTMQDGQRVLHGDALLNPAKADAAQEEKGAGFKSTFPMPTVATSGQTLQQIFGQKADTLFKDRPQLADAYYAVFRSAYAGLLAEHGNMKGVGEQELEQKALEIAIGKKSQLVDFNGATMRVPEGMDPSRFKGLVGNAVAAIARDTKAPADWADRIKGYQLEEIGGLGSGQYKLTNGNLDIVRPDHKGTFVIDLRGQYLPGKVTGLPAEQKSAPSVDNERFGATRGGLAGRDAAPP